MPADLSQYPPPQHMLRDLALEFEHGRDGESRAWLPVDEHVCTPAGHVHAGIVATAVDAIGGGLAAMVAAPGWIATSDLTLHVVAPLDVRRLEVRGRVVRAGRTTVVLAADVVDADAPHRSAAFATMTFSVLERRESNPVLVPRRYDEPVVRQMMDNDGSGFGAAAYERFGFVTRAPGVVEVEPAPYVGNSLGAVQGGVLASLADAATASALGDGFETIDLQLFYLALAKVGPIRADAEVLERGDRRGSVAVQIHDGGARRRTTAASTVGAKW